MCGGQREASRTAVTTEAQVLRSSPPHTPGPHREVAVRSHTGICSTPSPNKPQHARELRGPVKGDSTRSHAGVRVALLLKHTWNRPNRMSPPV